MLSFNVSHSNVNIFFYHLICSKVLPILVSLFIAPPPQNPCHPTPCGPNSQCREINGQAVCSCIQGYIGSPPTCRPECVTNADCPQTEACSNQKCRDPCIGTCGISAKCMVVNHNPICSCLPQYTGDPFVRCQVIGTWNLIQCLLIFRNTDLCREF